MNTQDRQLARVPESQAMSRIESVLIAGDLSKLSTQEREVYYLKVCETLGLNPLARPFDYITLQGKLVMYANKGCAEQLRSIRSISISVVTREKIDDLLVVTCEARDPSGRTDSATGAVNVSNLKGEALANAMMKAETKAKRRVTLSICGLNMLDETELDSADDEPTRTKATMPTVLTAASENQAKPAEQPKPQPVPQASRAFFEETPTSIGAAGTPAAFDPGWQTKADAVNAILDLGKKLGLKPGEITARVRDVVNKNPNEADMAELLMAYNDMLEKQRELDAKRRGK